MARKLTKALASKIRQVYIKNPKTFDIKAQAFKHNVDIAALEYLVDEWMAEIIQNDMLSDNDIVMSKPILSSTPRTSINDNTLSITSKAMILHHELLNTIGDTVATVKNLIANSPDGLYQKSAGASDSYGRVTEFIKDLLPALQLTAEYINPNTAISRILSGSADTEQHEEVINYPSDPMEAARRYQDLIKEVEDDIDSL